MNEFDDNDTHSTMTFVVDIYTFIGQSNVYKVIQHNLDIYCDHIDVGSSHDMSFNANNVYHYLKFIMQRHDGIEAKNLCYLFFGRRKWIWNI